MNRLLVPLSALLLYGIICPSVVIAAGTPPTLTVLAPIAQSKMYFNDDATGSLQWAEVTPWVLGADAPSGWQTYLIPTFDTYMCETPDNIFTLTSPKNIVDTGTCRLREQPAINTQNYQSAATLPLWKRDYSTLVSGHFINTPNGLTAYTINHGELENDDGKTVGVKLPVCVPAPNIGYGTTNGCDPNYWWGSFNSFITMSTFPWTLDNLSSNKLFDDLGPIIWPANGYAESLDGSSTWVKATESGLGMPSSIVDNGYIYVFYNDTSQGLESDGRGPGVKVARAPVTTNGIASSSFKTYYNGQFREPALPSDFSLSRGVDVYKEKGGRSSSLFPNEPVKSVSWTPGANRNDARKIAEIITFSVSKIEGTNLFLGVGHELSKGVTLRTSSDLIHWSDPAIIPGTAANYWTGVDLQRVPLLYPHPASADGNSNTDIDPNGFYVIGTQTATHPGTPYEAKVVNAVKLKMGVPTSPTNPSDLNGDGKVDIFDYNLLVTNFGHPYTIFDYNQLVANFGK